MKSSLQVDPERAVRLTRFTAIAVGIVFGLAAAGLGGVALMANSRASSEETLAKTLEEETVAVRKVLDDARTNGTANVRSHSKSIADFQESVAGLAKANGCSVSEFLASTDVQPFLTRFAKQADGAGWSQIEIQVTLTGSGRNVIEVVRRLAEQPVPLEFSSVQIAREAVGEGGSSVKAMLQLRVLVQSTGGPA